MQERSKRRGRRLLTLGTLSGKTKGVIWVERSFRSEIFGGGGRGNTVKGYTNATEETTAGEEIQKITENKEKQKPLFFG